MIRLAPILLLASAAAAQVLPPLPAASTPTARTNYFAATATVTLTNPSAPVECFALCSSSNLMDWRPVSGANNQIGRLK